MNCPKHPQQKMVELFFSTVCDLCSPTEGSVVEEPIKVAVWIHMNLSCFGLKGVWQVGKEAKHPIDSKILSIVISEDLKWSTHFNNTEAQGFNGYLSKIWELAVPPDDWSLALKGYWEGSLGTKKPLRVFHAWQ